MTDRETEYSALLAKIIPPYTSVIIHPARESALPISDRIRFHSPAGAQPESAGAVIIDERNLDAFRADPISLLGALVAGGAALLRLPAKAIARTEWEGCCRATSLHIQSIGGGEILTSTAVKSHLNAPRRADTANSILIPVRDRASFSKVQESIFAWVHFLLKRNMYDRTEFILVDDGVLTPADLTPFSELSLQGRLLVVAHYKPFGITEMIRSGFVFASGRRILVDESMGAVAPESFLHLLLPLLREEKKTKSLEERSVVHAWTPNGKRGGGRRQRGSYNPDSDFRLYSRDAARLALAKGPWKGKKGETLAFLLKQGWVVCDVPVDRVSGAE